jgi:hypothetical protein
LSSNDRVKRQSVKVTAMTRTPLIFLDVDGPLIPFRARPTQRKHRKVDATGNPLLERLDPADGHRLLKLGAELVWATTWMTEANEIIAPRLGLPPLPVADFPDSDEDPPNGLHWKTKPLTRWAAGRPFAWLDDEATDTDRQWITANHPEPTLIHRVDPMTGLTEADLTATARWLANLPGPRTV